MSSIELSSEVKQRREQLRRERESKTTSQLVRELRDDRRTREARILESIFGSND